MMIKGLKYWCLFGFLCYMYTVCYISSYVKGNSKGWNLTGQYIK